MDASDAATARAGTEKAEILARLRERIVAFAASRGWREEAEDLAQEVLSLLCEKYPDVHAPEDLVPLAFRILRFKMQALYRKSARRAEASAGELPSDPEDPHPNPELLALRHQMMERLQRALATLEPRCRQLWRLKLEGRTYREIQQILGARSINTVYTWDYRCRQALLERLGGRWGTEL